MVWDGLFWYLVARRDHGEKIRANQVGKNLADEFFGQVEK